MTESKYKQTILITPPGRKRDNLLALIESLEESIMIHCFENCQQIEEKIDPKLSTLIFIDCRHPDEKITKELNRLRKYRNNIHIVVLHSLIVQKLDILDLAITELQFDDISVEVLHHLLFNTNSPFLQLRD